MGIPVFRSFVKRKDMDFVLTSLVNDASEPGEFVDRFEKGIKESFGCDHVLLVRSAFSALQVALGSLGLARTDSVALPALAPLFYVKALESLGLSPVFLDAATESGDPDSKSIEQAFVAAAARPKALIWGGGGTCLPPETLFSEIGIPVIEDFTRRIGALRGEFPAKSQGAMTLLSFEHGSMLSAGGGACVMAMARREGTILRNIEDQVVPELRMSDYNAALGSAQLRELERTIEKRRELRKSFLQSLAAGRHKAFRQAGEGDSGLWSFPVVIESSVKDAVQYAKKKDIETIGAFEDSCLAAGLVPEGSCPVARSLLLRTLLFPLHQRIGNSGAQKVSRVLATLP